MAWPLLVLLVILSALYWRGSVERASILAKDDRLFEHIRYGVQEYHCRAHQRGFGEGSRKLFESARLIAFRLDTTAEVRIGFYFKDIEEYGIYGFVIKNGNELYESYYRSDRGFQLEQPLIFASHRAVSLHRPRMMRSF